MEGELYNYVDSKLLYQPCLNDTQKDKYYYYENDYNVYDTCDIFENINTHICSDCNGKFVYKNYCVNKCPLEAPYYVNVTYTLSHKKGKPSIYISKCVAKCTDENNKYKYIIEYKNQCWQNCNTPDGTYQLKLNGNKCFKVCSSPKFFEDMKNHQ